MRHEIYWGKVEHLRHAPQRHAFSYPVFTLGLDLATISKFDSPRWLLAYNRFALLSIHDRDYLTSGNQSLSQKLQQFLQSEGVTEPAAHTMLFTMPRFLGYVFNPVSFYLGRAATGELLYTVAEVHNTFGEAHLYLLRNGQPAQASPAGSPSLPAAGTSSSVDPSRFSPVSYEFPKKFFVSPFYPVAGDYRLSVLACEQSLDIMVELLDQGQQTFAARLLGSGQNLTNSSLLSTLLRYPFCILLTMVRIQAQALVLYFRRAVQVFLKPEPYAQHTVRSAPGLMDRFRLAVVAKMHGIRHKTSVRCTKKTK